MENKTENKLSFILITCILYAKNYSSRYRYNIYYTQNIIPKTLATNVHKTETLRDIRSESNKLIKWDWKMIGKVMPIRSLRVPGTFNVKQCNSQP